MKIQGWQTFKGYYGERPIHSWIEYRPSEPIPDELKFQGWQTYETVYEHEHNKAIHYWIRYRKDEPIPEDMKFEGW